MEHYFTNNDNLKSELRTITFKINDYSLDFTSDLGVFSKDKVDYGTRLLIENYIKHGKKDVSLLDVGCGYGIIGISLAKIMGVKSTLIDVNKRALHLAEKNIKDNEVEAIAFESNIYSNVTLKYDVVITNPPIRAGKQTVTDILLGAKEHLTEQGELWIVMRKDQGAKSMIEKLETIYQVSVLDKSKGFFIIIAKTY